MENIHVLKNNITNLRDTINSKFLKYYEIQDVYQNSDFSSDILKTEMEYITNRQIKVLYLDDDENILKMFKAFFKNDFKIFIASDTETAFKILKTENIDVFITDQIMPNITGIDFLIKIKEELEKLPIFMLLSTYIDKVSFVDIMDDVNIFKYLNKPFNVKEIKKTVKEAFEFSNKK